MTQAEENFHKIMEIEEAEIHSPLNILGTSQEFERDASQDEAALHIHYGCSITPEHVYEMAS